MLASRSRLGREFESAWNIMQAEVGDPIPGSLLASPAAVAGRHTHRVQAALTRARERCSFQNFDVLVRTLPHDDARRLAWLNVNRFSAAWVSAWPSPEAWLQDGEFMEIACRYFGLPSPACLPLVGQRIEGTRMQLDAYGFRLCAAPLPGDGFRTQHDTLKWALYEDLRRTGARATCEVYGLFAPLLPQAAREELDAQPARRRQGLVPDFLARLRSSAGAHLADVLLDVKTLHY
eukprot:7498191-Karenia_brevis.AAC.1